MTVHRPRPPRGRLPRWFLFALLAAALAAQPAPAQSVPLTITSGNATYTQDITPTFVDRGEFSGNFQTDTGGPASLHSQWMFYRIGNFSNDRERPFGNYTSGGVTTSLSGNAAGNTATYNLTDTRGATTRVTATWTLTLTDAPVAGSAGLNSSLTITNPNATPLTISLYHYLDFELNGPGGGGESATGGLSGFTQTEGDTTMVYTPVTSATAYRATDFPTLMKSLTNVSKSILDNTGLPLGPGHVTVAYQWDLTLGPNSSTTIDASMELDAVPVPVPEPALGLAVAALGLAVAAAQRRRSLRRHAL